MRICGIIIKSNTEMEKDLNSRTQYARGLSGKKIDICRVDPDILTVNSPFPAETLEYTGSDWRIIIVNQQEKRSSAGPVVFPVISLLCMFIVGLAFFLSGCGALHHETPKDAVELSDASVGDIVVFGDIRWYVIAKTDAGYTLLSEKPVIKQAFRKAGYGVFNVAWEESTVRAWLNEKFYNTFTEEEKALIAKTHNVTPDSVEYGTDGGGDTDDHIYLLSVDEANALDDNV